MREDEVSVIVATLGLAYPNNFKNYTEEQTLALIKFYQEQLQEYNYKTVKKSIDILIKNKKYLPTVAEIIETCENNKEVEISKIIMLMMKDNYFKSDEEIFRAQGWINLGVIPEWFKNDMKKYLVGGLKINGNNESKMLEYRL